MISGFINEQSQFKYTNLADILCFIIVIITSFLFQNLNNQVLTFVYTNSFKKLNS